jgi:DNA excision repair protein ERCC-3
VLVIGQYLEQLQQLATVFRLPLITGQTPNVDRERLYAAFRRGDLPRLIVSKVGNFASTCPTPTSRSRSPARSAAARRRRSVSAASCGRKPTGARRASTTLVSADTREQEFAQKRQLFLTEQGYAYAIVTAAQDVLHAAAARREARA